MNGLEPYDLGETYNLAICNYCHKEASKRTFGEIPGTFNYYCRRHYVVYVWGHRIFAAMLILFAIFTAYNSLIVLKNLPF